MFCPSDTEDDEWDCRSTGSDGVQEVIVVDSSPRRDTAPVEVSDSEEDEPEANAELLRRLGECCICLVRAANSLLTPCYHGFCAPCIARWLQVAQRPACPLCKQPPVSRVQTLGSPTEFSITDLRSGKVLYSSVGQSDSPRHHIYHHGAVTTQSRRLHSVRLSKAAPEYLSILSTDNGAPACDTVMWWAAHRRTSEGQVVKWLQRDLRVLTGLSDLQFLVDVVLSLMTRLPLTSAQAVAVMKDYLGPQTQIFLRELYLYLKSGPMELDAYDRKARQEVANDIFVPPDFDPAASVPRSPSHGICEAPNLQSTDCPNPCPLPLTSVTSSASRTRRVRIRPGKRKRTAEPPECDPIPRAACVLLAQTVPD